LFLRQQERSNVRSRASSLGRSPRSAVRRYGPGEFLAQDHLEPALAVHDRPEHLLVGAAGQERLVNDDGLPGGLGYRPDPVEPADPLLEAAGVPGQIVADDAPAEAVQIDAFPQELSCDKYFRKHGAVEGEHNAVAKLAIRLACDHFDIKPNTRQRP
jgi:hypothetical protein